MIKITPEVLEHVMSNEGVGAMMTEKHGDITDDVRNMHTALCECDGFRKIAEASAMSVALSVTGGPNGVVKVVASIMSAAFMLGLQAAEHQQGVAELDKLSKL